MKLIKLSLATLLLSTLTACGSGGGGGATDTSNNSSSTTPSTPPSQPSTTVNGNKLDIKKGPPVTIVEGNVQATTDKNTLMVDGKSVQLIPAGMSGEVVKIETAAHKYMVYNDLSYVKHGFYEDSSHTYYFAQGDVTSEKNMPSSGQVKYVGKSMSKTDASATVSAGGTAEFTVDFKDKTLSGTVSGGQLSAPVDLRATISGNSFKGEHNGTHTYGRFYGPQAEQLGGTFVNTVTNGLIGTFGAKKQ